MRPRDYPYALSLEEPKLFHCRFDFYSADGKKPDEKKQKNFAMFWMIEAYQQSSHLHHGIPIWKLVCFVL